MLQLDLGEDDGQLVDQMLLLVALPKDRGHLLLQVANDVSMDLERKTWRTSSMPRVLSHEAQNPFFVPCHPPRRPPYLEASFRILKE